MAYYALKKDVFDISKVTVVGSPTITSDGVASGFSSSNYLTLPNIGTILQNATNWSIKLPIIFADGTTTTRQEIFGGTLPGYPYSLIVRLWQSGYILVPVNGVTGTDSFTLQSKQTVVANTLYNLEIKVQDNVIYFYINDELQAQHNITEKVKFDDILRLGNSWTTGSPFLGSIDLPAFKIYVDNQLVFQPVKPTYLLERRKEGYDPSKFTVVGSPTITEYGVASGFSVSDYIKLPLLEGSGSIEKLQVSFNYLGTTTTSSRVIARMYETDLTIYSNQTGRIEVAQPSRYGTAYLLGANPVNRYSDCIVELILDKAQGKLTASYYENGVLIRTNTVSSTLKSLINSKYWTDYNIEKQWYLGCQGYGGAFPGSINLPSFSITSDGKEVFTGAKENYYMYGFAKPDYTPVNYLESTGTQWIDTLFTPQIGDEIELKNVQCVMNSTGFQTVFSAGTGDFQTILLVNTPAPLRAAFFKYFATGATQNIDLPLVLDTPTTIKVDGLGNIYYNDKFVVQSNPSGQVDSSLRLFYRTNNSSPMIGKIGAVTVKRNGKLVLDLIPVLNKDSIPCMYNLITKQYLPNQGTGQFLYG